MPYWDEYEKKKPTKKETAAKRKKDNATNMKGIQDTAKAANEMGMSYGQYVAWQHTQLERRMRLRRKQDE